jgi:hypothetical protein
MSVLDDEAKWCREQLRMAGLLERDCDCWILHTDACLAKQKEEKKDE